MNREDNYQLSRSCHFLSTELIVKKPTVKTQKMEELCLPDALQRYFSDFFVCCDEDKTGKASLPKTLELIKSGNVPEDVIAQVRARKQANLFT